MISKQPQAKRLRVPGHVIPIIRNAHPDLKKKIRAGLEYIQKEPQSAKSLRDEHEGLKCFSVGRFRIIYRISPKNIIEIVAIGPRKTLYEETFKLIKKEAGLK